MQLTFFLHFSSIFTLFFIPIFAHFLHIPVSLRVRVLLKDDK